MISIETSVACCVCGAADPEPMYRPARAPGPVVRCRSCGMVYVSPREDFRALIADGSQFDAFAHLRESHDLSDLADCWEIGELSVRLPERPMLAANHRQALATIAGYDPPGRRLLDFGAGWGFFMETAKAEGWVPTGLEPLPGRGVWARGHGLNMVTDTLRPDTFAPESFDVVTAFQVFEHLPDPAAELAKIHRLLAPGGLVVIEVPNIDTWSVRLLGPRHRHYVHDHLWLFGPRTLRRFLAAGGFEPLGTHLPTRRLSARFVSQTWLPKALPAGIASAITTILTQTNQLDREVPLNFGDIVLAVGRKKVVG